jgi:hypothetical protein
MQMVEAEGFVPQTLIDISGRGAACGLTCAGPD